MTNNVFDTIMQYDIDNIKLRTVINTLYINNRDSNCIHIDAPDTTSQISIMVLNGNRFINIDSRYDNLVKVLEKRNLIDISPCISPSNKIEHKSLDNKLEIAFNVIATSNVIESNLHNLISKNNNGHIYKGKYMTITVYYTNKYITNRIDNILCDPLVIRNDKHKLAINNDIAIPYFDSNIKIKTDDEIIGSNEIMFRLIKIYKIELKYDVNTTLYGSSISEYIPFNLELYFGMLLKIRNFSPRYLMTYVNNEIEDDIENTLTLIKTSLISIPYHVMNLEKYVDYNVKYKQYPICSINTIKWDRLYKPKPHNELHYVVLSQFLDEKNYQINYRRNNCIFDWSWRKFPDISYICPLSQLDDYITMPKSKDIYLDANLYLLPPKCKYYNGCSHTGYPIFCNHVHPKIYPKYTITNIITSNDHSTHNNAIGNVIGNVISNVINHGNNSTVNNNISHSSIAKTNKETNIMFIHRITNDKGISFEGQLDANNRLKVKVQNNRLGWNAIGYKVAKCNIDNKSVYCIVKLGLFKESIIAHEPEKKWTYNNKLYTDATYRSAKFRTNLCVVLGIIPYQYNKNKLNEVTHYANDGIKLLSTTSAKSCIYTTDFNYNEGEIIYISDFDEKINEVCLTGIHFFFDITVAISMLPSDCCGIDNNFQRYINNYRFFGMEKVPTLFEMIINKLKNVKYTEENEVVYILNKSVGVIDNIYGEGSSTMLSSNRLRSSEQYAVTQSLIESSSTITPSNITHSTESIIDSCQLNSRQMKLRVINIFNRSQLTTDDICVVCHEELLNNSITILPCGHMYCISCSTSGWIMDNNMCPMCKKRVR